MPPAHPNTAQDGQADSSVLPFSQLAEGSPQRSQFFQDERQVNRRKHQRLEALVEELKIAEERGMPAGSKLLVDARGLRVRQDRAANPRCQDRAANKSALLSAPDCCLPSLTDLLSVCLCEHRLVTKDVNTCAKSLRTALLPLLWTSDATV